METARENRHPWFPWLVAWFRPMKFLHDDPRMQEFADELGITLPNRTLDLAAAARTADIRGKADVERLDSGHKKNPAHRWVLSFRGSGGRIYLRSFGAQLVSAPHNRRCASGRLG